MNTRKISFKKLQNLYKHKYPHIAFKDFVILVCDQITDHKNKCKPKNCPEWNKLRKVGNKK